MQAYLGWRGRRSVEVAAIRSVEVLALLIIRLVPRSRAYDALVRLSAVLHAATHRLYAHLRRRSPKRDYRALLLRDMLCMATRKGGISIRVRLDGGDILDRVYAAHGRAILCTAHFGLTMAIFSALEARGLSAAAVGQVSTKRDRLHWGCIRPVKLIESDRLCLVRGRRVLEAGAVVTVFPDVSRAPANQPDTGDNGFDVEPNIFDFAQLVGVPVLFFSAGLERTGTIVLDIVEPPHSLPRDTAEADALIGEYCSFLEERSGRPCAAAARTRQPPPPPLRRAA